LDVDFFFISIFFLKKKKRPGPFPSTPVRVSEPSPHPTPTSRYFGALHSVLGLPASALVELIFKQKKKKTPQKKETNLIPATRTSVPLKKKTIETV